SSDTRCRTGFGVRGCAITLARRPKCAMSAHSVRIHLRSGTHFAPRTGTFLGPWGENVMNGPKERPLLLVVDDEIPVLKVVERLAARIGFDVVTCANGADAMRTLLRRPADLAMVDLRMPDVNGLDL